MTVSRLPANLVTSPDARPLSTRLWGFLVSAERNTSAGAPCSIFVASAVELSVEIVSVVPGFAASQAVFTLASTDLSEAAA
jgi:hypothetical protein